MMLAPMRTDPRDHSPPFRRLNGRVMRRRWRIVLLVGLAGCGPEFADYAPACLEDHPGDVRCCPLGGHVDHNTCCAAGMHGVPDVEHPDWVVCVWDEDAGADAQ